MIYINMLTEYKNSPISINVNNELFACNIIYDARAEDICTTTTKYERGRSQISFDNDKMNKFIEFQLTQYINNRYSFEINPGTIYDIPIHSINNNAIPSHNTEWSELYSDTYTKYK